VLRLESNGFQDETLAVELPPKTRQIDLGEIRLQPLRERTLRVLDSDGAVVKDLSLGWGLLGMQGGDLPGKDGTFKLELGPRPVDAILSNEGFYPLPVRLSVKGPAEVRLPGGCLMISVRDLKGEPVKAVAYIDHVDLRDASAKRTLKGVPPGTHTVIVGAKGFASAVRQMTWKAGETLTAEFTLSPR
jgi:hypothetical protein